MSFCTNLKCERAIKGNVYLSIFHVFYTVIWWQCDELNESTFLKIKSEFFYRYICGLSPNCLKRLDRFV